MSSSGVVVPLPACSPRDCHATSKVPTPEVSSLVDPEPVNSSPFHSVLALLTTGLGMISPSRALAARWAGGARSAPLSVITPQSGGDHTGGKIGQIRAPSRQRDRKSTRLNSRHVATSYAALCLKKKSRHQWRTPDREPTRSAA